MSKTEAETEASKKYLATEKGKKALKKGIKKYLATEKGKETHKKAVRIYKAKNVNTIEIKRETFKKIKVIKDLENSSWTEIIEKLLSK
jgi:uncharacterized pyridoxamine 5'-phosphate oxidase family protein